jgi:hypothetical protein
VQESVSVFRFVFCVFGTRDFVCGRSVMAQRSKGSGVCTHLAAESRYPFLPAELDQALLPKETRCDRLVLLLGLFGLCRRLLGSLCLHLRHHSLLRSDLRLELRLVLRWCWAVRVIWLLRNRRQSGWLIDSSFLEEL